MLQVAQDFRDEVDDFHAFLVGLPESTWSRETGFMAWTPWDVVAHLHFFDYASLTALKGEEVFAAERKRLIAEAGAGKTNREIARARFAGLDAKALLAEWQSTAHALAQALGAAQPKQRVPWYGPDMGVSMFTTARYMETWAHAQEVYDLVAAERTHTDRIKHVATIGVKTFGWTFVNRGREVPGAPPHIRLDAPSGDVWEWNEESDEESVSGDAVEFCQVVTQGRNVADTRLTVRGPIATDWMSIAQCFAGGAIDPPAPGTRGPKN